MSEHEVDVPWRASDGTEWISAHPTGEGWTGWQPGEDGVWLLTVEEFRQQYPEAPSTTRAGGASA